MSNRYPHPDIDTLPADIKEKLLAVQEKLGFVPNVFMVLARRPAEWRAFFAYHDALMDPESCGRSSHLSKGDREMIVVAVSSANGCMNCVVMHGAALRLYEKKPLVADQVAVNWRKADISPRQRAMLEFAMKVLHQSNALQDADFEALHAHGFDDEDAWDIAHIVGFYCMGNRSANFGNIMPNPEYYLMGRVLREKR
ncbi:MAG TPA: peroxidase-related enzyme [Ottowia sp.]|uniref:peroxidase-related enzyme n=1 Tax=Ottowia sp. TaxID=1898956 RepID=UPI002BEDF430|nr:peroxidase-related enzyme [Ottowia sp.]HMN20860.1 peroxidase-related enzyme [Ottowia sp.]